MSTRKQIKSLIFLNLDQAVIFIIGNLFPSTFLPVSKRHQTWIPRGSNKSTLPVFPLLSWWSLGSPLSFRSILSISTSVPFKPWGPLGSTLSLRASFSFDAILSISPQVSARSRRPLGSSLPLDTLVTFGSITAISSVTAWYPRGTRFAIHLGNCSTIDARGLLNWKENYALSSYKL